MSITPLFTPFLKVALFQGLKPGQITKIAQNADRITFRDGDKILVAEREGDAAFLIVSGQVQRLDPSKQNLDNNEPNETDHQTADRQSQIITTPTGTLLGELSMLIDGHFHSATYIAKGTVRAFKLTRTAIHAQMESDPDLADHFVQIIARRLHAVADELRQIDQTLAPKPPALPAQLISGQAKLMETQPA